MTTLDQWTLDEDGLTVLVRVIDDAEANADPAGQGDVYGPEDIAAHRRGDWQFAGITVTPVIGGEEIESARDDLWTVEVGTNPGRWGDSPDGPDTIGRQYLTTVHPVPEMIPEVRGKLAALYGQLAGMQLQDCPAYNPAEEASNIAGAHCRRALGHKPPHRDYNGQEFYMP